MKEYFWNLAESTSDHVFIINGQQGSDKEIWSRALACNILCISPTEDGACLNCDICKYTAAGSNPDFVELLDEEGKKNIPIEEIRTKIHAEIFLNPQIGVKKLWLINGNVLSEIAQNALLKVLEEPPQYAYFIIYLDDKTNLLPTLRSRAIEIDIPNMNVAEIDELLNQLQIEDGIKRKLIHNFSAGLPQIATNIAKDVDFNNSRLEIFNWFNDFIRHNAADILTEDYSFWEGYKARIDTILLFLQSFIRDMTITISSKNYNTIHKQQTLNNYSVKEQLLNPDLLDSYNKICSNYNIKKLKKVMDELVNLKIYLDANANFEMTICSSLLKIRTILA